MLSVSAWLDLAAMDITQKVLDVTAQAPDNVRKAVPHPSQLDIAIVARVADLLTPIAARRISKTA